MADLDELIGQSPAMGTLRSDVARLLGLARERGRLPAILIEGETGTGKGLVAKLLHRHGPRSRGPFVDLNCAAIPETLLEGELFGYERGAFTDARRAKPGLFQASSGGVLFLDEVALLPENVQAKLLTAIEEKAVRRLGGTVKETFDTWLVSATNMDLRLAVRRRKFREDLYHRLAVLTLHLPPLRERAGDAVLLAERFLERACREYGVPAKSLSPDARALVTRSPWPGNVRELANVMERVALLVDRTDVRAADLEVTQHTEEAPPPPRSEAGEREQLVAALEATGWNILRTASRLGLARNTVRARMDRWGLRGQRPAAETTPPAAEAAPAGPPPIGTPPSSPRPRIGAVRWDRRHVTLLRVTLVGTTDLSVDAGRLLSLAADKVRGFGGRTEALGRMSLDASFGVVPIESAARRAVSAALALHRALTDASRSELGVTTVAHTEQVTLGLTADAIVIEEADRATLGAMLARLRAQAQPGSVQVSAATAPFVERHFELRADESADASAASFTVVRPDPTGVGGRWNRTPFVDREAEMDLLRARWELARNGRGQIIGVVGEPGAGKSRLLLEFTRPLTADGALVVRLPLSATEDPSRSRPSATLLGLLFGIDAGDAADDVRRKLAARLGALKLDGALLPPLAALLQLDADDGDWARLDPQQRARRMLDALRRVMVRESLVRPLVIVVEDVHWIDADTQVAIDGLIDIIPSARILVVLAYRPEYAHAWTGKTFYTQLRVDPLPSAASGRLLDHLLGDAPDFAALKGQLTAWTEGNPFFLEECVRTLAETGVLAGAPGAFRVVGEMATDTLPATVEDTLAARVHRLSADARHVLQCAAAIGTDFADAVLASVADLPDDVLAASLRALEDAEFVYAAAASGEAGRTFKHALTHLVAYRSLPRERQRLLHARILTALETLPGVSDVQTEALAEHAVRGEVWSKAVVFLRHAGARALVRSAHRAAADYFERAIAALERTDAPSSHADVAVDLRLDLRHALTPLGEVDRTLRHLREAETVAARIGDRRRLGRVLSFQTNCLFSLGDHPAAIDCGHRALAIARDLDDLPMSIAAEQFVGRALHAQGSYRAAIEIFGRLAASLTGQRASENLGLPVPPGVFVRSHLVWCLAELGEFDEASRVGDEALRLAEATGQPEALQWAGYALGILALDRGDFEAAVTRLERVVSICETADLPVYLPRTGAALSHAYVLIGQADAVIRLEHWVAEAGRRRQVNVQASALVRLVDAYLHAGRIDDAVPAAERAVDLSRKRGERGTEARALRLQAAAYDRMAPPRVKDVEAPYRAALALAEELEMRPQAARCRLGLGTLLAAAGRTDEARRLLEAAATDARGLGLSRVAAEAAREVAALG
jgi:transcriptional regulator with AAA-type ATPase domain/tetratricopeptide (TPR) repeat protein